MGNGVFSVLQRVSGGFARALVGLFLGGAVVLGACSSSDNPACEGVVIRGQCQKKCVESVCEAQGMKCVSNACEQPCTNHSDCPIGKDCFVTSFPDGTEANYCDFSGKKAIGDACASDDDCDAARNQKCLNDVCTLTGCQYDSDCQDVPGTCVKDPSGNYCKPGNPVYGPGHSCTAPSECDSAFALACVGGTCAFMCDSHDDCAGIGLCQAAKDAGGKDVLVCTKGTTYPAGQYGTACPSGPSGTECDAANNFVCYGYENEVDSYCTKSGCQQDSDCATGYTCQALGTSRGPCAAACGLQATATNCVPADKIGDGKEYTCGPVGLLHHLCIKRDYCTSCQSDDDCRGLPNQVCADDGSGKKICTQLCDPDITESCPWANASKCGITDTTLNLPTCSHRFGACVGNGQDCEPCVDDADCPDGFCTVGGFSGEKFCVSLKQTCTCLPCNGDADCSGGNIKCVSGTCFGLTTKCTVDADCNTTCNGSCKSQQCATDADCGTGTCNRACKTGQACTVDTDCGTGGKCASNGVCYSHACTQDSDCGTNGTCPMGGCNAHACTQDSDCGPTGTCQGYCKGVSTDQDVTCLGGGCPKTPGGLVMTCYGGNAAKNSSLYNLCFGANTHPLSPNEPQVGCWPNP